MKSVLFFLLLSTPVVAQSPQATTESAAPGRLHNCAMYYPPSAIRSHTEGVTTLAFQVTAAGSVTNVTVKKSSGHPALDDASVKCVQQWQYIPGRKKDIPTDAYKQANIVWRLNDSALLYAIESAALDCIRKVKPKDGSLAKAAKDTVVQIQFNRERYSFPFSGGGPPSVQLISHSGNDDLDDLVTGCLKHLPPDLPVDTSVTLDFVIPFSWKRDTQPRAATSPEPSQ